MTEILPQDPARLPTPPQQPNDPPWLKDHEERMQAVYAREKATRDNELLGAFRSAVMSDPKLEAHAATIAQRLGRPRETLGDDLQVAEEVVRLGELQEFHRKNPELDRFLRNMTPVRMLHDDLGKLKLVTEAFDNFKRNFESGETVNEAGVLKAKSAFRQLTAVEQDRLNEIEAIQAMSELETGVFDEASKILGQMVGPMLQATGVGVVAGGAASALSGPGALLTGPAAFAAGSLSTLFAHSAVVEFGHEYATIYEQLTGAGVDPTEAHETAKLMAGAYALGAASVETISGGIVGKPFVGAGRKIAGKLLGQTGLAKESATSAGARFLKEMLAGLAAETSEEGIQQLMAAGFENLAGTVKGVDTGPTFDEALAQTGDVMLKTLKGMSLIAPLGPAIHFAADLNRVREAQGATELFNRIAETVTETETLGRSPQTLAQLVAAKVEGTKAANVYIEGPLLAQALVAAGQTREQLAVDLPDVARQLREAERTGDDVVIPMGDFAAKIAPSKLYPALQKSIRLQKDGYSQDQAEAWTAEQQQNREATAATIGELAVRGTEWQKQSDAVEARMLTEVQKDTRLQPTVAKFIASRYRLWVEAQAEREGKLPAQFDAENRLTFDVQRDRQRESAHLFQEKDGNRRLDTPEFKDWFGESKVVDETGKPLVVYHGTGAEMFEAFDPEGKTVRPGFGHGSHFAENPDIANFYSEQWKDGNRQEPRGERSYPVYLRVENPYTGNFYDENEVLKNASDAIIRQYIEDRRTLRYAQAATNALKAQGFDGIRYKHGEIGRARGNTVAWVAFEPTQIKSVNNRGTWSRESKNLLHQSEAGRLDTPEFKDWFGESKVVDETGKPLVVHHSGTFDEDVDPIPHVNGQGFHFGTKAAAEIRAAHKPVDDWLVDLVVEQDADTGAWYWQSGPDESFELVSEEGFASSEEARRDAEQFALGLDTGDYEAPLTKAYLSIKNPKRVPDQGRDWAGAIAKAKAEGHDGLVYRNTYEDKGSDSYVVFEPTQIKSVNNRGTWSRESKNLLHQSEAGPTTFYSALARGIETLPVEGPLTLERWREEIARLIDKGIVKQAEVFWTGLEDFIEGSIEDARLRRFELVIGDEAGRRGTAEDAARWREQIRSGELTDAHVEENEAKPAVTKENVLQFLRSHRVKVEARIDDGEGEWIVSDGQGSEERFDSEAEAQEHVTRAQLEQIDDIVNKLRIEIEKRTDTETETNDDGDEVDIETTKYVVTFRRGYLPSSRLERTFPDDEVEFDTEREAESYRGEIEEEVRDWVYENFEMFVTDGGNRDPKNEYETYTVDGPSKDYSEVAIVWDTGATLFDADDHPFGSTAVNKNRLVHLRYTVRKIETEASPLPDESTWMKSAEADEVLRQFRERHGREPSHTEMHDHYWKLREQTSKRRYAVFVEEVQSDWADRGRDGQFVQTYRPSKDPAAVAAARARLKKHIEKTQQLNEAEGVSVEAQFRAMIDASKAKIAELPVLGGTAVEMQRLTTDLANQEYALAELLAEREAKALQERRARGETPNEADFDRLRALVVDRDLAELKAKRAKKTARKAPFVHTTDAWTTLALKQALVIAADRGLDTVVLINGEQAADLYGLSAHIDHLEWFLPTTIPSGRRAYDAVDQLEWLLAGTPEGVKDRTKKVVTATGTHAKTGKPINTSFTVNSAGVIPHGNGDLSGHTLDKVIGKAAAEKVLADWSVDGAAGQMDPDDLAVGDQGMLASYGNADGYQTTGRDGKVRFDANGKPVPAIVPKLLRDLAKDIGGETLSVNLPGATVGKENFAVKLSPEAIAKVKEGFPLFQKDEELQGAFDPTTNEAFIYEAGNASTFWHEMNHFWLTTLFKMASKPEASVSVRRDAQTLLDWFGVKDIDTWNAMSLDQQRRHHEAFARTGELILHEGKAPDVNEEQIRLFQVVARWIRRTYRYLRDTLNAQHKKAFGVDLPVLTAEVRAVYDRMLVAEDTIAAAEAQRAMAPMFREKPAGMSDLDWAEYQLHGDVGHETAVGKVISASLSTMKWLSGARDKLKRGVNREARKLRAGIEDAERAAAQQEPVYIARRALERGESVEPDGTVVPVQMPKLDAGAVASILVNNDLSIDALDAVTVDKGGAHPDALAEMFGFGSGESMVVALASAPDLETAVQQRTDARMLAEHSDLADPDAIERKIEEVLHNENRARAVASELRFFAKILTPVRVMVRAAKAHAREVLGRKRIGSVHQHEHVQAEVRHRREAEKALKKGEHALVVHHKRKELLESQMAREALTIRQEIDDAKKVFRKLFKPDSKLAKSRNVDYIAIARALVAAFGLAPGEKLADAYVKQLQAYNPEMFERLEPILDRARQWAEDAAEQGRTVKTWKDLTVDEFRDLTETVEALWHQSLREEQFAAEGKKLLLDDVAAKVVAQNAKAGTPVEPLLGAETPSEKRASGFRRLLFLATRPEHWAWRKDGANKVGAFTRYFWRPVRDAVNRYVADRNHYTKRVADMVRKLRPKLKLGTIEFKDAQGKVLHVFGRGNGGFGQAELIAALLHTGNEGNLRRLILGRKWGSYDPETETLDASDWQAFVAEQVKAGNITKDVMDFVQSIWDLNEELKPLAQKAHRDMLGFYFKEVEPVPVVMPFGSYRGGYMPAKLDASARSAGRVTSLKDLEQDYRKQFATTGRGFTKERSEVFAEPLLLDLDLVPAHIDDVLRFAHIQPAVRDVEKLAKHKDVAEALHATQPEVWDRMILPWLQRVASQSATKRGVSPDLDNFMRAVRSSAGMSVMFANIANTLQQLTGLLSAALRVKPKFLFRALWKLLSQRGDFLREIAEASPGFMGQRQKSQIFDSVEAISDLMQNRSKFAKARAWAKRNAYVFQSTMQNLVDAVAWGGAYEQALEQQGKTASDAEAHVEAVKQADAAVRMTQSSFDPTDVAGYEEQTPFGKLFTMFSGYFNTMANMQADQLVRIGQATGMAKAGLAFQAYLLGFAAPMLLADAITRTMRDQWDDEDEDGDVDVLTADFLFLGQLRSALAEVPVAGPNVLSPMVGWFDNEVWNDRMTSSPAVALFERAGQGTVRAVKAAFDPEKDIEGRNVRDVLTLLGVLFGLPTFGRQVGYGFDVAAGEVEPTVRGALTGVAPR